MIATDFAIRIDRIVIEKILQSIRPSTKFPARPRSEICE
jgi:hypothetical protein